jgi:hypothetical protein
MTIQLRVQNRVPVHFVLILLVGAERLRDLDCIARSTFPFLQWRWRPDLEPDELIERKRRVSENRGCTAAAEQMDEAEPSGDSLHIRPLKIEGCR